MRRSNSAFHQHDDEVVILLPDLRILRLIARSVFLAAVIVTFPWLHTIIAVQMQHEVINTPKWVDDAVMLPTLVEDLKREGLFDAKLNNLFLGDPGSRVSYLKDNEMVLVDIECLKLLIVHNSVDFVMAGNGLGEMDFRFVDRVLKVGGIAAVRLVEDKGRLFRLPGNYRMVYIKRFGSTILGIKKISHVILHDVKVGLNGRKLLSRRKFGGGGERLYDVKLMQVKRMIVFVQAFVKKILYGDESDMDIGQRKLLSTKELKDNAFMSILMLTRTKKKTMHMQIQTIVPNMVDFEINLHGIVVESNGLLIVKSDDGAHLYDISKLKQTNKAIIDMHIFGFGSTVVVIKMNMHGNGVLKGKKLLFVEKLKDGAMEKKPKNVERYFVKVQSKDELLQELCIEVDYTRKRWVSVLMNAKGKMFNVMERMKKIWMASNKMMVETG